MLGLHKPEESEYLDTVTSIKQNIFLKSQAINSKRTSWHLEAFIFYSILKDTSYNVGTVSSLLCSPLFLQYLKYSPVRIHNKNIAGCWGDDDKHPSKIQRKLGM